MEIIKYKVGINQPDTKITQKISIKPKLIALNLFLKYKLKNKLIKNDKRDKT